jgi:hypothetical protein
VDQRKKNAQDEGRAGGTPSAAREDEMPTPFVQRPPPMSKCHKGNFPPFFDNLMVYECSSSSTQLSVFAMHC